MGTMVVKKDYQSLSNELDEILVQLQSPSVSIDEALELYKQGEKLVKELNRYLETAKNKVVLVTKSEVRA